MAGLYKVKVQDVGFGVRGKASRVRASQVLHHFVPLADSALLLLRAPCRRSFRSVPAVGQTRPSCLKKPIFLEVSGLQATFSATVSRHPDRVQGQLGLSPCDLRFRRSWALRRVAWEDGFLAQTPPSTEGAAGTSDVRVPKPRIPEWSSPTRTPNFQNLCILNRSGTFTGTRPSPRLVLNTGPKHP